ncbi:MAG: hypothetical protein M3O46_21910 [Myxococcota bacterium]|nr:hypothetical protein [Myxococcota bacterium]
MFERTCELVVVVRPRALRRDVVYGPLLQRAIELVREQSRVVAATGALDAMMDAEEVVVGARETREGSGDLVFVVRGVRAEVDPAKLIDEAGRALWAPGPDGPATDVRELVPAHPEAAAAGGGVESRGREDAADASLFELPGRTWVIATGRARTRARDAFSRAREPGSDAMDSRPSRRGLLSDVDGHALAVVRVSGPSLVSRVRVLRAPGLLAPVGHGLASVTVVLPPGDDPILRAIFAYKDHEAVPPAETTVRSAIGALTSAKSEDYGWLRPATVRSSDCCVEVTTPMPPRLMDGFLHPEAALPHAAGASPRF